jgi:hypothetical protein
MKTQNETPIIDWSYPAPENAFDRFIGPGASRAEILLQLVPPLIMTAAWLIIAVVNRWGWSLLQMAVAGILMVDMLGGVITNATGAAKRWYHRSGQGVGQHLRFVALHLVQPTLIVLLFEMGNWAFVVGSFGYLVFAALLILRVPLYLQRPLAALLLALSFFWALYVLPVPVHFEWFLPVYYTKLLVCHLLREEPYRPTPTEHPVA